MDNTFGDWPLLKALFSFRERREKERQQLADLVGKNLTYMSQLEGLDFPLYRVSTLAEAII